MLSIKRLTRRLGRQTLSEVKVSNSNDKVPLSTVFQAQIG